MSNLTLKEQEKYKREIELAKAGEKKKGFMKDLGWSLLAYTLFFSGFGFLEFRVNPWRSILFFILAFILDIVCIFSYIQYPKKKYAKDDNYKT